MGFWNRIDAMARCRAAEDRDEERTRFAWSNPDRSSMKPRRCKIAQAGLSGPVPRFSEAYG